MVKFVGSWVSQCGDERAPGLVFSIQVKCGSTNTARWSWVASGRYGAGGAGLDFEEPLGLLWGPCGVPWTNPPGFRSVGLYALGNEGRQ